MKWQKAGCKSPRASALEGANPSIVVNSFYKKTGELV